MSKAFGSFPSEISLASMWRGLRRTGSAAALSLAVLGMSPAYAEVDVNSADEAALNPLGGAIALGHPLGASGAVLMTRMINHMRDNGIRYGLQTMCEGGGTANATLVELVA